MSRMLCGVSTSKWVTVPGKMTMSDKPRIGSDSGRDLDQTLVPEASGLPPAPRMLINSVSDSGVVMPRVNHSETVPWGGVETKGMSTRKNPF